MVGIIKKINQKSSVGKIFKSVPLALPADNLFLPPIGELEALIVSLISNRSIEIKNFVT
jgi:hypothetical protein